jgi:hypothetical protein
VHRIRGTFGDVSWDTECTQIMPSFSHDAPIATASRDSDFSDSRQLLISPIMTYASVDQARNLFLPRSFHHSKWLLSSSALVHPHAQVAVKLNQFTMFTAVGTQVVLIDLESNQLAPVEPPSSVFAWRRMEAAQALII